MSDDPDIATKRYRVAEVLSDPFDWEDPRRDQIREEVLDPSIWSDYKIELMFRVVIQGCT